jgi:hypothetical protein
MQNFENEDEDDAASLILDPTGGLWPPEASLNPEPYA